jgi:dihydrodipicolinate synthase/N-acetylneuraminate lyase
MHQRPGTRLLQGIFNIVPTPTVKEGSLLELSDSVDHVETRQMVRMLIDGGVDGLMTNGTFGEGATVTEPELYQFVNDIVTEAQGAVPIFAGATTNSTRETINRSKELMRLGADGLFLGRPMWSRTDDETILAFYRDVADAVDGAPIVIYDNPEVFKGKISPKVYRGLAAIPNIIGAKYVGISGQFLADVEACGDDLALLPVEEHWYYARRWVGDLAPAFWTGSGNCGMSPLIALRNAVLASDDEGALRITNEIRHAMAPLFPDGSFAKFSTYNVALEKARFAAAGLIDPGRVRPPYDHVPPAYLRGAQEAGHRWAALHLAYSAAPLLST